MKLCQMLNLIKSRPELKMGHAGSKTRSLDQFLENPFVHSRRHFYPIFMKLCQIVLLNEIKARIKIIHVGLKTRSLGQF